MLLLLIPAFAHPASAFVVRNDAFSLTIDDRTGSLTVAGPQGETIWRSGEFGLWQIRFQDGSRLSASDFDQPGRSVTVQPGEPLRLTYDSPEARAVVTVSARDDGADLTGEVTPHQKVVLDFALPGRLRFEPDQVMRFVCPENGNSSVGTAFNARFFGPQPQDRPSGWRPQTAGPAGYEALVGGPLDQRADVEPTVPLRATDQAREWLPPAVVDRISSMQAIVNRPSTRAQVDLVIADSDNGPYYAAASLGGTGRLWRVGGAVGDGEEALVSSMVTATIRRLAESPPAGRTKVGLIDLPHGPERGSWAEVRVRDWREGLRAVAEATGRSFVALTSAAEMLAATSGSDFVAILNPYGEWAPVPPDGDMPATVAALGQYVRAGGNWFEVGGYPFYYAMRPLLYLSHGSPYPDAFADFLHLDAQGGSASVYRVQPQTHEPWVGAQDHAAIFVPGNLGCGGDEQGGYCDRPFGTYVKPGETWRAPTVRMTIGNTPEAGLKAYCEANAILRRLEDKMTPEVLDKFKHSVLVYYAGACREKTQNLDLLPVPTQVHFADYLKGGFDKQYPDHLPPSPTFGTPEEFRAFFDRAHALGHLVMPYTNPTWWCDHPKGPTFEREGTDPLLKTLAGEPSYERYAANDGYTVCHWHPAVRAANAKTLREFTEEYPVDILFQDQCGARGWQYDTNPSSPTPYAYSEGLISMVAEDSRTKPLSTESGWDRVVNYESQLCGMSWAIVPTEGGPAWRTLMKHSIPPDTWEVYPLAQYIAHDKTAMLYHDLGQFVTNREVLSWTMGLGFSLSYRVGAAGLRNDAPREWLRWLDRLQKSVCARYIGEPVTAFRHDRSPTPTVEHDGVIRATYGPVTVAANLGPEARDDLPPFGFRATAEGLVAGDVADADGRITSFVAERSGGGTDLWVYAPPECQATVELPEPRAASVTLDDGTKLEARREGNTLTFRLPARPGVVRLAPPPELADKAPRDWPGARPAIGILDLGPNVHPTWTAITPQQWVTAFEQSKLAREDGLAVKRIATLPELADALAAGPTKWLAIVNAYGEQFPAAADWRATLAQVRSYVSNGGSWWETGGYSLYIALSPEGNAWKGTPVQASGMATLGLPVGGGEVDQAPEPLQVTPLGRTVLGDDLTSRVAALTSSVNRGLPRGGDDPGHCALVAGAKQDFIGAYRLHGWGYFWRIGGFNPNPDVALPVAVAAMQYVFDYPPLPIEGGGISYLWHATVSR
ncbi:MAG: hypothetical protein FJX75_20920 [Armatimonadetes bacterium]|nr:hypothetical protein [Armatimonadota bacterium]